jgi:hypothetical protein
VWLPQIQREAKTAQAWTIDGVFSEVTLRVAVDP